MNKNNVLTKGQQYFAVILAVALSLLVVWGAVFGATTISTNVNTGGTLTVSGDSSFANASTTGMLTVAGGIISTASSTAVAAFNVNGATDLNSTLNVDGLSTLAGYISTASSTAVAALNANGLTTLNGGLVSVASTTAVAAFNVNGVTLLKGTLRASSTVFTSGDITASSTLATTTLALSGTAGGSASCIQLVAGNGSIVRIYASTTPANGDVGISVLRVEAGACK